MRSLMAIMFLVMAIGLGYQYFFVKPKPDQQQPAQTQSQTAVPSAPSSPAAPGQTPAAASAAQAPAAMPQITAEMETTATVENEFYKIVFSNRGAQVKSWILKKYFDSSGKPLDLVQPQAAARFGFPLALFTYEPALTTQLNDALYQVNYGGAQPTATGLLLAPTSISFHYAANGIDALKTIRFDTSYVVTIESQVTRNGAPVRTLVEWPAGLGDMEEFKPTSMLGRQMRTPSYFAWSVDGRQNSTGPNPSGFLFWQQPGVSGNNTIDEPYQYAAVMDLYFAAAFMPDVPDRATAVTLHNAIDLPGNPSDPNSKKTPADVLGLAVGDTSGFTRLRVFAGPKQMDLLKSVHASGSSGKLDGPSLEPLIEFGWMSILSKPVYFALRFLRKLLGAGLYSWGWAIVIFTALFNLLVLPSRISMMKQSLKLQRVQPKLDAIKKRYANLKMNDPKRMEMQQEQMALMKAEGVNMYGSCLPMLLQLPLFSAYYYVLARAIELRQAHWFWLRDLSAADPLYVLPGIIILTMFLTQFITPSPGMDPTQRRMMAIVMPIFMGFMFGHLASGLALYMATGGVINLIMQIAINRSHWGREMQAHAVRRAAKKSGGNLKTIQGRR